MGREEEQNKDSSGWMELMKTLKRETKEGMYDVSCDYAVINYGFYGEKHINSASFPVFNFLGLLVSFCALWDIAYSERE